MGLPFTAKWLQIACDQYQSLPQRTREQVDERVQQILDQPGGPGQRFDLLSNQWTTVYGAGAGLILYAVVQDHQRVLILRLV